jgi:hypothetical protein
VDTAKENPGYVLSISVGDCEDLGLKVEHKPVEGNPSHCELRLPSGATKSQIALIRERFLEVALLLRVDGDQVFGG